MNVDTYIQSFPNEVQQRLMLIRATIQHVAPQAVEGIAYGMPAYRAYGKPLVYFAAFQKHIGFYALPSGHLQFAAELSAYKQGKGSVQFPLYLPLPIDLIERMVVCRLAENERIAGKRSAK